MCQAPAVYSNASDSCEPCSLNCLECETGTHVCTSCEDGYYISDKGACDACTTQCAECGDGTNTNCPTCATGYYKLPGTNQCEDYCPSGLTPDEPLQTCVEYDVTSICFEFNDNQIALQNPSGVVISLGPDPIPFPVYQRGIYFPGNTNLVIENLILNTTFMIEFVIRPENLGNLLSVTSRNEKNVYTYDIFLNVMNVRQRDLPEVSDLTWESLKWQNMAVVIDMYDITFYKNGQAGST